MAEIFKPVDSKETNKELLKQKNSINLLTDSKISDMKKILA